MARKRQAHSGPPEWIVTFADMMSLLLCFFILILSFSTQDRKKMEAMAGSMRETFGTQTEIRRTGMIEIPGMPIRRFFEDTAPVPSPSPTNQFSQRATEPRQQMSSTPTSDEDRTRNERQRQFSTAAATLRQAWQEMPEIQAISRNIMVEETPEGVLITLMDQDNRAMFPEGSRFPVERTRRALELLAPVVARLPNQIQIAGHTTSRRPTGRPDYDNWELSADRANAVRRVLMEHGVRADRFHSVEGRADGQPLFANDRTLSANARVTILLMQATSALPPGARP